MSDKISVGIIGYGYWGPNLARNFIATPNCNLHSICDFRKERLESLNLSFPNVYTTTDPEELLNNSEMDAIVIATPVFTHFELAKKALLNGKHVLIEKPMTSSVKEASELIELAQKKGKLLMVDHTFLYTGAVQKMKELIDTNELGNINYFDSTRINLGLFQPDINVLWDLAPHDISILNFLIKEKPYSINASGVSHTNNKIENIAYLTINYNSGLIAHFNCSWSSPVKIRMTLIGGDKKTIVYNDMEPTEKVKIYDTGYSLKTEEDKRQILVDYRIGDIYTPKLKGQEALFGMANDFIACIINNKSPISDSNLGLEVVKILEASQKSIKQNSKEIIL